MDIDRVLHDVVSHYAVASVIVGAFAVNFKVAERSPGWRKRARFLVLLLSVTLGIAFCWGASAAAGRRLSSGIEALLTLGLASGLGTLYAWVPTEKRITRALSYA